MESALTLFQPKETQRLAFRPLTESDAPWIYEYAKDPRVGPAAGWPAHTSVENSRQIVRDFLSNPGTYGIILKDVGHTIGCVGVMRGKASGLPIPETEGEIGYWIGVPFWGRGIAAEAASAMINCAFNDMNLDRLWLSHYVENERSKRVAVKCGFQYRYTLRDLYCELIDEVRDSRVMALERDFVRRLLPHEFNDAVELIRDAFLQDVAPQFSREGVETFLALLNDRAKLATLEWFGAFDGGRLVGTAAASDKRHIKFFFTRRENQRRGIGRAIFNAISNACECKRITVASAPNAVGFYERLGFREVLPENCIDGIRFVSMAYDRVEK